jgi:hypothetical protein
MEEAAPFIRGDPRELASLINRMKALKCLYPPKRLRPFPFGDSGLNSGISALPRLSFLPERGLVEQLVDNYFNTFERSFPLLCADEFRIDFDSFWNCPDAVGDAWLSQLYMMLALSCFASPTISFQDVPGGHVGLSERCIDGAESALMNRGQYMTKPNLTTLRVLCLISIAKQIDIVTLDDSDGSWVFMGFVMRIGMGMCLHIGASSFEAMPKIEAMARRRIWNTMMLLDSTTALDSGMPLVLRPEDYDSSSLSQNEPRGNESLPSTEAVPPRMLIDEYYQKILADVTPIAAAIINKANSTSPKFGRDQIKDYDKRIRHLLRKADICITPQKAVIEVVLHRCLLAMHQSCGINPDNHCQDSEHCRLTLHESALTLLHLQTALFDDFSYRWLGDMFVRDFGVAGLHVCVGLRSRTYDDSKEGPHSKSQAKAALHRIPEVIKSNLHRSRHYFKMYKAYVALIAGLEAMEAGGSIRDALYQAGLNVIEAVEGCAGPRIVNSASGLSAMVDPMLQLSPTSEIGLPFFDTDLVCPLHFFTYAAQANNFLAFPRVSGRLSVGTVVEKS